MLLNKRLYIKQTFCERCAPNVVVKYFLENSIADFKEKSPKIGNFRTDLVISSVFLVKCCTIFIVSCPAKNTFKYQTKINI